MKSEIRIVCDDHPGRATTVATMFRDRVGTWHDQGGPSATPDGTLVIHDGGGTTGLVGDRVARDNVNASDHEEPERYGHNLRCDRCGLAAAIRGERLDAGLDAAQRAGIEEIPLRALTG